MNLNDTAIESPRRTELIINAAKIAGLDLSQLLMVALDAIDAEPLPEVCPYYSIMLDQDDHDPNLFMMHLINFMSGSDDDYDDLVHDLAHALEETEPCEDHPNRCSICCDDH